MSTGKPPHRYRLLEKWAAANGYSVRWANPIPLDHVGSSVKMFFGNVAGGTMFYVVFGHQNGRNRRGWVLCRDSFLGRKTKRVRIRWDETVSESLEWEALAAE